MSVVLIDEQNREAFRKLLTGEAYYGMAEKKNVFCLGAVCDDVAVGALAGYPDEDNFRIISLFVAPSYRRKGFATKLIEELQEDLIDEARTLSIRFAVTDPETESLCGFFESAGFFEDDRGGKNTYIAEMSEVSQVLEKLREQIEKRPEYEGMMRLCELSQKEINAVDKFASEQGSPVPDDGIGGKDIEKDFSYLMIRDKVLEGYCIIDRSVLELPTIAAVWVRKNNPQIMAHLLYRSLSRVRDFMPEEPYIAMTAVTENSVSLIKKHLPRAIGISYTYYRTIERM